MSRINFIMTRKPCIDTCPNCGGNMVGDGWTTVRRCENVDLELVEDMEPDAGPVFCSC